jgi:hypothetical protein
MKTRNGKILLSGIFLIPDLVTAPEAREYEPLKTRNSRTSELSSYLYSPTANKLRQHLVYTKDNTLEYGKIVYESLMPVFGLEKSTRKRGQGQLITI